MNALARLRSGVRASTTNRDDLFSAWHRTLGRSLYMTDIDAVEYRIDDGKIRVAAILELKAWRVTSAEHVLGANLIVKLALARAAGVPLFHVWADFDRDEPRFLVWNVSKTGPIEEYRRKLVELSEEEMKLFLSRL